MDDAFRQKARDARAAVIAGALRGAALRDAIVAVPFLDRDVFVDEMLGIEPPPDDAPLPRGAVPYLPCGVEEILALELSPRDVMVDLGAGLGRVAILVHLLSGARAHGIEIQEPLVARARALALELGLDGVTFEHGDATEQELAGTVFFLYAPFDGTMLARVTQRLAAVARPFVVAAVGLEFDEPWLVPRPSSSVALALYDAR